MVCGRLRRMDIEGRKEGRKEGREETARNNKEMRGEEMTGREESINTAQTHGTEGRRMHERTREVLRHVPVRVHLPAHVRRRPRPLRVRRVRRRRRGRVRVRVRRRRRRTHAVDLRRVRVLRVVPLLLLVLLGVVPLLRVRVPRHLVRPAAIRAIRARDARRLERRLRIRPVRAHIREPEVRVPRRVHVVAPPVRAAALHVRGRHRRGCAVVVVLCAAVVAGVVVVRCGAVPARAVRCGVLVVVVEEHRRGASHSSRARRSALRARGRRR
ncbi:hypothetical protein B0H10DRAFT_986197 [Mycena sp. CBHHK59/15]|nr:hypothetical protein B0H10DRAFT_986197 [Mycena sp. CBHHK59/15]